jgi:poly(hydroxyalkanoate) depolymerase family esterase
MEDITATIERALRAAGLNPNAGRMADASQVISRALRDAGVNPQTHSTPFSPVAPDPSLHLHTGAPNAPGARVFGRSPPERSDDARFTLHLHAQGKASRRYKLYVPASATGSAMPLIVMLHGCKQDADDFANGTRMNQLAERHRFVVAYPAQSVGANGNNCWNWFHGVEQTRAGVEASLIAGITRSVADKVAIDERRVFVAGLSAGAAMAVILGANYPDVFAGVAAHSGLPLGAAHDVPSAFAAMQGRSGASSGQRAARDDERRTPARQPAVRTIVFHGDADATVVAANGGAIVERALSAFSAERRIEFTEVRESGAAAGRSWTTTRHVDAEGRPHVESWLVHGAAHAWCGGSPSGSFTDAKGPDASAEIVRFFLQ